MNNKKKLWILVALAAVLLAGLIYVAVTLINKPVNGPTASVDGTKATSSVNEQGSADATSGDNTATGGNAQATEATTEPTFPIDAVGGSEDLGETYPIEEQPTIVPAETEPVPPPTGAEDPLNEEFDITTLTYESYIAMNGDQQQAVINQFSTPEHFVKWYKAAEAAYKAEHPEIEIGGDTIIDGSDIGG